MLFEPTGLDERARTLSGSIHPRTLCAQSTADESAGRRPLDHLVETAARSLPPDVREELRSRVLGLLVVDLAVAEPADDAARRRTDDLFEALSAEIDLNFGVGGWGAEASRCGEAGSSAAAVGLPKNRYGRRRLCYGIGHGCHGQDI